MNFLQRMLSRLLPGRTTDEPAPQVVRIGIAAQVAAGVRMDPDLALRNATAWACTTFLARMTAQLPWRVMMESERGPRRAPTHPVDYLLRSRPNPEMSSFAFRETMVGWACRRGNAVAEIVTDGRGIPAQLWPIHPSRVEFKRDDATGGLIYEVRNAPGDIVQLTADRVFHVRGFGEGVVGLDVMSYAAESLGWARATELFGSTYFGNGIQPSGMVVIPREARLSAPAKLELQKELNDDHRGAQKKNRVLVVDQGMDFKRFTEQPNNAQFIETRQHQIEEICRWFGVPPHKVMHLLRATFTNIEHQSIEVVVDSITPWTLRFEQEADYKFFGANRAALFTKMDLKGLLRGDFKSRQEGLQIMRRNGAVNANEWRALEELDGIGPQGDLYVIEANMTTLEALRAQSRTAPPKLVPAAPDPSADPNADPGSVTPIARARLQRARAGVHSRAEGGSE